MTLGTFEPEGFSFSDIGGAAILEELAAQIDTFVDENVGDLLQYLIVEEERNEVSFEADCARFDVMHDGELYTRKTSLLAMVDNACGWGGQDPEPLQKTLETLKVAVERIEQALADRAARK